MVFENKCFIFLFVSLIGMFFLSTYALGSIQISGCSELNQTGETYYLTRDIINSTNTCMEFTANDIVLDCQGNMIDANGSGATESDYGIMAWYNDNITVKNCVLTDWTYSIYFYYTNNSFFINNTVSNSEDIAVLMWFACNNNTFTKNNLNHNTNGNGVGFYVRGYSNNNSFVNNTVSHNSIGFYIELSSDNTLKENYIENNTAGSAVGIGLVSSSDNKIYNNFLNQSNNVGYGGDVYEDQWNVTKRSGERIFSSGNQIGGNYWTNSTGNGFSDTCPDTEKDGFCDQVYDVYNDTTCTPGLDCSQDVDYLPLSDEYSCTIPTENLYINEDTTLCPGTYYLNDTDTNGVIIINSNNVVLDCNGTTLQGNDTSGSIAIQIGSHDHVNITNCIIKNYEEGIKQVQNINSYSLMENITLESMISAAIIIEGLYNGAELKHITLKNITVLSSGHNQDSKWAFTLQHIDDLNLTNCTSKNSESYGFYFEDIQQSNIDNIRAINNSYGINFDWGSSNNLTNIISINNSVHGVRLDDYFTNNNLVNLTTNYNGGHGIISFGSSSNNFTHVISNYNDCGIDIRYGSSNNNFTDVEVINNTYDGIWIGYGTPSIDSNIFRNVTSSYNMYGIVFSSEAANNTIYNSRFEKNDYGIYISSAGSSGPNKIYNCLLNNTDNVYFEGTVYSNEWNTTNQTGTRIYSAGNYIGGNYYTNSTGNGFSDTCPDSEQDGFCDQVYDVYNDTWCEPGVNCSDNVDYLPLSDEYLDCGSYINKDTNLGKDITGCTGTIFYINASDITLDCQNHYLQSSGSYGINNTGFDNVTIKNCRINMSEETSQKAIYYAYADNGKIDNNTITMECYGGIIIELWSEYNNITNNKVNLTNENCGQHGIDLNFYSGHSTISDNIINAEFEEGIYLRSDYNTIKRNKIYAGYHGIYLYYADYNIFENNNVTSNGPAMGTYPTSETITHNNFTGGSFISFGGVEYELYKFDKTNFFRDTNFTSPRKIKFRDTNSWFNYNNQTSGGVWVNTSVSAEATIQRELTSWTQSLVQWNDSASGITAYYNISGLLPQTSYKVYNNSVLAYTLQTDSSGVLPQFSIYLGSECEIKVQIFSENEYNLTGRVLFWENGTPVSGAQVVAKIYEDSKFLTQGSGATDSYGNYSIDIYYDFEEDKRYLANITVTKGSYQAHLKHYFRL